MGKVKDLSGQKFGRLTALEYNQERSPHGRVIWKCICDCGNICFVVSRYLIFGGTKSCGCLKTELIRSLGKSTALSYGKAKFNALYSAYKNRALKRNLVFKLTKNEFEKLTKQNCYYCGQEPKQIMENLNHSGEYIYNGVDRIDNSKGYEIDNCVPCCKQCNTAKNTKTQEEFIAWINRVFTTQMELRK